VVDAVIKAHRPLHALAGQTHLPGKVRHGEGLASELDGASQAAMMGSGRA
jgi:hypothetical protein